MVFYGGIFEMVIGAAREGRGVNFVDLFSGFRKFGKFLIFWLVMVGIGIVCGLVALIPIIGSIADLVFLVWLGVTWLYVLPLIADRGMTFGEAARTSSAMVKGTGWWKTLGIVVVLDGRHLRDRHRDRSDRQGLVGPQRHPDAGPGDRRGPVRHLLREHDVPGGRRRGRRRRGSRRCRELRSRRRPLRRPYASPAVGGQAYQPAVPPAPPAPPAPFSPGVAGGAATPLGAAGATDPAAATMAAASAWKAAADPLAAGAPQAATPVAAPATPVEAAAAPVEAAAAPVEAAAAEATAAVEEAETAVTEAAAAQATPAVEEAGTAVTEAAGEAQAAAGEAESAAGEAATAAETAVTDVKAPPAPGAAQGSAGAGRLTLRGLWPASTQRPRGRRRDAPPPPSCCRAL